VLIYYSTPPKRSVMARAGVPSTPSLRHASKGMDARPSPSMTMVE
jgi:hypothetical protein